MRFVVYVEVEEDGTAMAHVPALPGCISTGQDEDMALARIPQAITEYYNWLKRHGERIPDQIDPIELEVAGTSNDTGHPGDAMSLFPSDRVPMTEQEVATMFRLMNYSRQDLLQLVRDLLPELLNWKPRGGQGEESWDINDILEHVASAEQFYVSRLSTNVLSMLQDTRSVAVERLSRMSEAERTQVVQHVGELWSARKIFRRMLEHEHEHIHHIQVVLEHFSASQGLKS